MQNKTAFTFNDISLVPSFSDVARKTIDMSNALSKIPVMSSPMDTVTGLTMLKAMFRAGAIGVHHRYCSLEALKEAVPWGGIAVSPSMKIDNIESICDPNATFLVMDVAHGYTKKNLDFCKALSQDGYKVYSGNICTVEAAEAYLNAGASGLRIGIGSGDACTTRVVTGIGVPQAFAVQDIYRSFKNSTFIISDGGCKTTGDIVKALALGADAVMMGRMFAGADEAPYPGSYRGMASEGALGTRKAEFFVEGISKTVETTGPVHIMIKEIKDAIAQAFYYLGVNSIEELHENVEYVFVTSNGYREGLA